MTPFLAMRVVWAGRDSNPRRHSHLIYSQAQLTTLLPTQKLRHVGAAPTTPEGNGFLQLIKVARLSHYRALTVFR